MVNRFFGNHKHKWIILIILISVFWGGSGVNQDAIWVDELTTISHIGGVDGPFNMTQVASSLSKLSPKHSPLYFIALNQWSNLTGWHPITLRMLSVLFGVLSIAGIYRLATDIHSHKLGLISAFFMGTSVFYLTTYHELRMYALLVNMCILTVWAYLRVIDTGHTPSRLTWFALILGIDGMMYTQPFSVLVLIGIGIYHVVFVSKSLRWWKIVGAFFLALIIYLPWVPVTVWGLMSNFDTDDYATDSLTALHGFGYLVSNGNWILLIGLIGLGIRYIRSANQTVKTIFILGFICLLNLLAGNALAGLLPPNRMRYFYIIWIFWIMIMAFGFIHLNRKWLQITIIGVWLVSGAVLQTSEYLVYVQGATWRVHDYPDYHQLIADLSNHVQPDDYLLSFTETEFVHMEGKRGRSTSDFYLTQFLGIDGQFMRGFETDEDIIQLDFEAKVQRQPIILFAYPKNDPPSALNLAQQNLKEQYTFCEQVVDGDKFIANRYVRNGLICGQPLQRIIYDRDIVADYQISEDGDLVTVMIGWTLPDVVESGEYAMSIQVHNSSNNNVAQQDLPLLNESGIQWITVSFDFSKFTADIYQIIAIVYSREDGTRLSAHNGETLQSSEFLLLHSVMR